FYEKCLSLLSSDGVSSLITSNKWMRAGYGASTREYFYKNADVLRIIDLGAGRFESATVDVNIIFYSKTKEKYIRGERSFDGVSYSGNLKELKSAKFNTVVSDVSKEWVIMNDLERSIFKKISKHKALKDWDIDINAGIKTGYNEAFIIDENTKNKLIQKDINSKFLIKPMLKGRNILKYKCNFHNLYIIATLPALNLNINDYPAIKNYLKSFGKRLEQSGEKGCRKKTNNKWFETQDSIVYYNNFQKPKIMFNKASKINAFYLDNEGKYYGDVTTYILSSNNNLKYLLSILNSHMFYYAYNKYYAGGGIEGELTLFTLELFPIPEVNSKTKNKMVKLVDKIIELKKQNENTSDLEDEIDKIVYSLYGLNDEEIKIIEG
ncbi:TaqI-like C-terminal specificity domain-containing protein, partial [Brachyspira sp.]|uniref:TaqI-like C-terminal specificity domain-containing protein n=1 Tax=Brachyspira sp. TaxID=1977261 RepID=UPI00261CD5D2